MKSKHGEIKILSLDTLLIAAPLAIGSAVAVGLVMVHLGFRKVKDVKWLKK